MNDYSYLRTILTSDSIEVLVKAFKSLSNEGLEVYVANSNKGFKLATEKSLKSGDVLMVPAADWNFAEELLECIDLKEYVTNCEIPENAKSEVEIAQEKYFKKRKWTYIETAVIIVVVMIYYLFKTIFH